MVTDWSHWQSGEDDCLWYILLLMVRDCRIYWSWMEKLVNFIIAKEWELCWTPQQTTALLARQWRIRTVLNRWDDDGGELLILQSDCVMQQMVIVGAMCHWHLVIFTLPQQNWHPLTNHQTILSQVITSSTSTTIPNLVQICPREGEEGGLLWVEGWSILFILFWGVGNLRHSWLEHVQNAYVAE